MKATAEQEQQDSRGPEDEPGSNQGTPQLEDDPLTPTDAVQLRVRQLCNRRLFLLETQSFRKAADDGRTSGELTSQDPDTVCELQAVEKELEELLREKMENQGQSSAISQQSAHPARKSARPCGGIYLLPRFHLAEEELTEEPGAATTTDSAVKAAAVVPVDSLAQTSAVTQCPSCREVVLTKTSSRAGQTSWTMCCLCCMLGCVIGCCLIPFFMKRLKSVGHQCPQCRELIHTYEPL